MPDKLSDLFRPLIGCLLPAFLLACYLADTLLSANPVESVLPTFQKDLIKLSLFGLITGTTLHQITERFNLKLARYYPLLGIALYFVVNSGYDAYLWLASGKALASIGPEIFNNLVPAFFLGGGFGVLYWLLAIQKSVQLVFFIVLIMGGISLVYIKEILRYFLV